MRTDAEILSQIRAEDRARIEIANALLRIRTTPETIAIADIIRATIDALKLIPGDPLAYRECYDELCARHPSIQGELL